MISQPTQPTNAGSVFFKRNLIHPTDMGPSAAGRRCVLILKPGPIPLRWRLSFSFFLSLALSLPFFDTPEIISSPHDVALHEIRSNRLRYSRLSRHEPLLPARHWLFVPLFSIAVIACSMLTYETLHRRMCDRCHMFHQRRQHRMLVVSFPLPPTRHPREQ